MKFEYGPGAEESLIKLLPDGICEFESSVRMSSANSRIDEIGVHLLTPGLSGAAVYLVHRLSNGNRLISWVAKAAHKVGIIDQERDNYERLIQGRLITVPQLVDRGNPRILFFQFAVQTGNNSPETLRQGYSKTSIEALEALMQRIVQSIKPLHQLSDDSRSPIDRMPEIADFSSLKNKLDAVVPLLSSDLIMQWKSLCQARDRCPMIRSKAHGDLNSGNVLFEPGSIASSPVFIDFASMMRSKDNEYYSEGFHFPFWDFAKLERDLVTRLFLKEALSEGLDNNEILALVRFALGSDERLSEETRASESVHKLIRVLSSLRKEIQRTTVPEYYEGCYKVVLAYALMAVLFRSSPDTDIDSKTQNLVAAQGAITLLSAPFIKLSSLDPISLWTTGHSSFNKESQYLQSYYASSRRLSRYAEINTAMNILMNRESSRLSCTNSQDNNDSSPFSETDLRSSFSYHLSQDMAELAILARSRLSLMDYKEYSNKQLLRDYFTKTELKNIDFASGEVVEVYTDDIAAGEIQMISDVIWCCSFFARVENIDLLWGKAFVNIENGRSELLLDNRPEAWYGKPAIINDQVISKLKLFADSFTHLAIELLEHTYSLYHNGKRKVLSFGGFLKDFNLKQFKKEFTRHKQASPSASDGDLAHRALLDTSFGKARLQLGITQFDIRVIWESDEYMSKSDFALGIPQVVIIVDARRPLLKS